MTRHRIIGSEAFGGRPPVVLREIRRRRRRRPVRALLLGALCALPVVLLVLAGVLA